MYSIDLIINVREQKFPGMKVPVNKVLGTKVPKNKSSTYGTFVLVNESSQV